MPPIHILAQYSHLISDLINSGYDENLYTLFSDLDITEISVDDFICVIATLPDYNDNTDNTNNTDLKRRTTMHVMRYEYSQRAKLLSKIAEYTTIMHKLYDLKLSYKCIDKNDGYENNEDNTNTNADNVVNNNQKCNEDNNQKYNDDNNQKYKCNENNINRNDIMTKIEKNIKQIKTELQIDEHTHPITLNDINKFDIEYHTLIKTIDLYNNKFNDRNATWDNYITHISIENFLMACDKLKMTPTINFVIKRNIKLHIPMQRSLINATIRDTVICDAFNNGYRFVYNDVIMIEHRYLTTDRTDPQEHSYITAINTGLRVTKLINARTLDKIHISACANLTSLRIFKNIRMDDLSSCYKCRSLTSLDISDCSNISSINMRNMRSLRELNCNNCNNNKSEDNYGISNFKLKNNFFPKGLRILYICPKLLPDKRGVHVRGPELLMNNKCLRKCRSIEKLVCDNNEHITSCSSFAKSLRILSIRDRCSITDAGLKKCMHIRELDCSGNHNIQSCDPFALSLRVLIMYGLYGMSDDGLVKCARLEKLNCTYNPRITTCEPFASSLCVLICKSSGICDDGLKKCTHIEKLDCSNVRDITTCEPFALSLRILVSRFSGICDDGLKKCIHLEKLDCCKHSKNCSYESRDTYDTNDLISDIGLKQCKNISELHCCYNKKITTCAPFHKSLRILNANYSNITDGGIALCTNIHTISFYGNSQITTCIPFIRSLKYLCCDYSMTEKIRLMRKNMDVDHCKYLNYCEHRANLHKHFKLSEDLGDFDDR